ncbi:serine hydrolase domain-containing protein [Kribbella qitaiheensis]|nr:serine hydrolase domain-containing protein [Kribbella qitaiheensis]
MDRLSVILRSAVKTFRVPAAQFAVHRGGTTTTFEVGESEPGNGGIVSGTEKFPIGSITKAFTATTAMVLVADGELGLDTSVAEYDLGWASLPMPLSGQLTLRHLLSHTSGLPDAGTPTGSSPRGYLLDCCRDMADIHRPGGQFSYSSAGYVLVGSLVERVTGMSWREAVDAIVLQPLGIPPVFITDPTDEQQVAGHSVNRALERTRAVAQTLTPVEEPAGGLAMSASDLVAFGRIFLDDPGVPVGVPLPPEYRAQMRTPVPSAQPYGLADGWGLGLAMFDSGPSRWWGHDGNADGTSCHLRVDPAGTVMALTTNANTGYAMWRQLVADIGAPGLAIGEHVAAADTASPAAGTGAEECLGNYTNGDTGYAVVRRDGGGLRMAVDGEPFAELTLHDDLHFTVRDLTTGDLTQTGRFLLDDATARVDRMLLGGRLAWRE